MATARAIEKFRNAAKDYLKDEKFSDFTIVCEDQEFKVHRCFISTHSPFFKQCCSGMFEETQTNKVELKEDLKEVVEKMIMFFYTFDYDDSVNAEPLPGIKSGRPAMQSQMNAHIYALAEKYQVDDLKALAIEKIKKTADVSSRIQMLALAYTTWTVIELPPNDTILHQVVKDMWLMGAADWLDIEHTDSLDSFFKHMPGFMTEMFLKLSSGMKNATVRFTCSKCKRDETMARASAIQYEYKKCKYCSSTEAVVTILGPVPFEKLW